MTKECTFNNVNIMNKVIYIQSTPHLKKAEIYSSKIEDSFVVFCHPNTKNSFQFSKVFVPMTNAQRFEAICINKLICPALEN